MAKQYITNNHTTPLEFPVTGGGFKRVEPGATESLDLLDPNSKQIQAWRHVSMISISDKKPEVNEKVTAVAAPVIESAGQDIGGADGLATPSSSGATPPSKTADSSKT